MATFPGFGIVVMAMIGLFGMAEGDPNMNQVSWNCNLEEMDPNGPEPNTVADLLMSLVYSTPDSGYSFYSKGKSPTRDFYGHAACYGMLSHDDCKTCLVSAYYMVFHHCKYKVGGQVQLQDCRMRFEDYPFTE